jgi:hypothetical protein
MQLQASFSTGGTSMSSQSVTELRDPHARRLLVDEAEWRDRLNQLADMRRVLSDTSVAAGDAMRVVPIGEHGDTTASR